MYNSSENVIDVGGKEFKFTWASERGELCDIYEERHSGEDGNGLLLECGSAWRKVNVQRILDESAKNLVKMRSEEAERLSKSRKSIVLDPANPSVKNQAKSMAAAAVEGNMRRMPWKHKKENFFKKSQAAVVAPTRSITKVGKKSNAVAKGSFSASPVPSPPEQSGPSVSTFPLGTDANVIPESNNEVIVPFDLNKEENSKVEKEIPSRVSRGVNHRTSGNSSSLDDSTTDLRSLLISVLSENPKGMSLKALEKAVGDAIPNPSKKIEAIIKNIATFQAPGRYLLKSGLEVENSKRHASDSGSSLENAPYQTSLAVSNKAIDENIEEAPPNLKIDESDTFERIDVGGSPSSPVGDGKASNDSDDRAGSSSESGSDSDSDSDTSDSGSDSGSQSRSPVESGSGSSSDSDSDASSSSKEGSDVIVDITSDDDKGESGPRTVAEDLKLSTSPKDLRALEDEDEQIDIGTNLEHKITSPIIDLNDFEKGDDEAAAPTENLTASNRDKSSEIPKSKDTRNTTTDPDRMDPWFSGKLDQDKLSEDRLPPNAESLVGETGQLVKQSVNDKKTTFKDGLNHGLSKVTERSGKPKLKRPSGANNSHEKPQSAKRPKSSYSADIMSSEKAEALFSEHSQDLPPDNRMDDRLTQSADWKVHMDLNVEDSTLTMNGRSIGPVNLRKINQSPSVGSVPTLHYEQPREKFEKTSGRKKTTDKVHRPWNSMDNLARGNARSEGFPVTCDDLGDSVPRKRSRHGEPSLLDEKMHKRVKDGTNDLNSTNLTKQTRGTMGADRILPFSESYESNGQSSNVQKNNVERSPFNGKKVLQRELSDLELGEFREPSLDDDSGRSRKPFERNDSSKSLDTKLTNVDNSFSNVSNRKTATNAFHDQKKPSPQNLGGGAHISQERFHRKVLADDIVDTTRPQQRANLSQSRQLLRTDNPDSEAMLYLDRPAEIASKKETRTTQGTVLDHADSNKKKPAVRLPQNGNKHVLESKRQKSSSPAENENDTAGGRRDSSSDEDNFFYSKYDKDEPELKGPIKDYPQYKDYVQEYNEKYEAYCYLNNQLEKTRDDFLKIGHDLGLAKGRDVGQYYSIVEKLRDMYQQSGASHKLMKKVFLLLHEELKTIKQRIKDFAEAYTKE